MSDGVVSQIILSLKNKRSDNQGHNQTSSDGKEVLSGPIAQKMKKMRESDEYGPVAKKGNRDSGQLLKHQNTDKEQLIVIEEAENQLEAMKVNYNTN